MRITRRKVHYEARTFELVHAFPLQVRFDSQMHSRKTLKCEKKVTYERVSVPMRRSDMHYAVNHQ